MDMRLTILLVVLALAQPMAVARGRGHPPTRKAHHEHHAKKRIARHVVKSARAAPIPAPPVEAPAAAPPAFASRLELPPQASDDEVAGRPRKR